MADVIGEHAKHGQTTHILNRIENCTGLYSSELLSIQVECPKFISISLRVTVQTFLLTARYSRRIDSW